MTKAARQLVQNWCVYLAVSVPTTYALFVSCWGTGPGRSYHQLFANGVGFQLLLIWASITLVFSLRFFRKTAPKRQTPISWFIVLGIVGWGLLAAKFSPLLIGHNSGPIALIASYASLVLALVISPWLPTNMNDGEERPTRGDIWLMLGICALGLSTYGLMGYFKQIHFGFSARDTAIFEQAIWHLSRFEAPASSIRGYANLWADHLHLVLVLFAPIIWISRTTLGLYLSLATAVVSGVVPAYLIATKTTRNRMAGVGIALAYLSFGGLQQGFDFGFYPEFLVAPLVLWIVYLLMERRLWLMWLCVIVALATKEDTGLSLAVLGLVIAIRKEWRVIGLSLAAVSFSWTILALKVIIPYFVGSSSYQYWTYGDLGANPQALIKTVVLHPLRALDVLTHPAVKFSTITHYFGDFAFLPFGSGLVILAGTYIAENFLSGDSRFWMYALEHHAMVAPFLVLATIDTIRRLERRVPGVASWLGVALIINLLFQNRLGDYALYQLATQPERRVLAREPQTEALLATIPQSAKVSALAGLAVPLDRRAAIFDNPNGSAESDFVVLRTTGSTWPLSPAEAIAEISSYQHSPAWRLRDQVNGTYVFERIQ